MSHDVFKKLELEEMQDVLTQVNPVLNVSGFEASETTIMSQILDFYPGYQLLDVADYSTMPEKHSYVIYKPDHIVPITWSNDPIYALNSDVPISLNEKNIEDYVRFFFRYVRGRKGRFLLIENVDDIPWRDDPPPSARKAIGNMLCPVTFIGFDSEENYMVDVRLVFKNSLFKTSVIIEPAGLISLEDEELLVDDLPVMDELFGQ